MVVYKLFPFKDATLYSFYPDMNTGIDPITDISNLNIAVATNPQVARFLTEFVQSEIEDVINSIEGIQENAVIGVPHKDLGESVLSIIIKEEYIQINSKKILEILTKKLAKYKCPKGYIFVNSFPRNSLGKILKNKLREEYKNYFK